MWQPALPEVSEVQLFGSEAWRICRAVVWMPPPAPVSLSGVAPPRPNMLLLDPGASCEPLRHSLNPNTVSSPKWCLHRWNHLQNVSRLAGASSWVSPVSQCQQQPHPGIRTEAHSWEGVRMLVQHSAANSASGTVARGAGGCPVHRWSH